MAGCIIIDKRLNSISLSVATDLSPCYFKDDYCNFYEGFDGPLNIISHDLYKGDLSHDFQLDGGSPYVKDGILSLPLVKDGKKLAATVISTTRLLNYGSYGKRIALKVEWKLWCD